MGGGSGSEIVEEIFVILILESTKSRDGCLRMLNCKKRHRGGPGPRYVGNG